MLTVQALPRRHEPWPHTRRAERARTVIDIGTALDLLAAAVEHRGTDFVYQPVWVDESRYLTCRYANRGAPDCIVGQALAFADIGAHDLEALDDDGVQELYLRGNYPSR